MDNREAFPQMEVVMRQPFKNTGEGASKVRQNTANAIRFNPEIYTQTKGQLSPTVAEELVRRSKKGEVHFLDAGPGNGGGLRAAENVSPRVIAHGLGLNYPIQQSYVPKGRWIRRHFESTVLKKRGESEGFIDVVQSRFGIEHASNKAIALENLLNSLRVGGKFFQPATSDSRHDPELVTTLEKQGFRVSLEKKPETSWVITRTTKAEADLRKFYGDESNDVPILADSK